MALGILLTRDDVLWNVCLVSRRVGRVEVESGAERGILYVKCFGGKSVWTWITAGLLLLGR